MVVPNVATQRAREILVQLQENFERATGDGQHPQQVRSLDMTSRDHGVAAPAAVQPNEDSFSMVFDAVLKVEGPTVSRRLLAWMEYIYRMGRNDAAQPVRKYYVRLLNAYANSRSDNAGTLAEGVLRHMNRTGLVAPDTVCYNIAIKAWTRSKRGREAAEHADRILDEMPVPKDLVTYSTVIAAWGASGMRSHAVARAEKLLRDIEESPDLEANTIVLNTVMATWVKSRNPQAANRTGELLDYMQTSMHAPADLVGHNTHLHALSLHADKRPGDAQRATDILESLEDSYRRGRIKFRPNLFSYNTVIAAWARSRDHDAAWKALGVLRKLIEVGERGGPQPDTLSFNQVLAALSRSRKPGVARLAERLLDYMEDGSAKGSIALGNVRADVVSYTSVVIGLARSGEPDAAERGERLLERLKRNTVLGERRT
jgi:PPR repeat